MDRFPAARVVPHGALARLRASAGHAGRAVRRAWAKIATQVLILALTTVGFAGVLAMTFVLAQQAITVHPVVETPAPRPMVIYFMKQPAAHPVRQAMQSLRAAQQEVEARGAYNTCCY